jgi:hypothetical protein
MKTSRQISDWNASAGVGENDSKQRQKKYGLGAEDAVEGRSGARQARDQKVKEKEEPGSSSERERERKRERDLSSTRSSTPAATVSHERRIMSCASHELSEAQLPDLLSA